MLGRTVLGADDGRGLAEVLAVGVPEADGVATLGSMSDRWPARLSATGWVVGTTEMADWAVPRSSPICSPRAVVMTPQVVRTAAAAVRRAQRCSWGASTSKSPAPSATSSASEARWATA